MRPARLAGKEITMSKILIASTPLLGHVSPMLLVATALKEKGHESSPERYFGIG